MELCNSLKKEIGIEISCVIVKISLELMSDILMFQRVSLFYFLLKLEMQLTNINYIEIEILKCYNRIHSIIYLVKWAINLTKYLWKLHNYLISQ